VDEQIPGCPRAFYTHSTKESRRKMISLPNNSFSSFNKTKRITIQFSKEIRSVAHPCGEWRARCMDEVIKFHVYRLVSMPVNEFYASTRCIERFNSKEE